MSNGVRRTRSTNVAMTGLSMEHDDQLGFVSCLTCRPVLCSLLIIFNRELQSNIKLNFIGETRVILLAEGQMTLGIRSPCQIQTQIYQSVYRRLASFARLPLLDGLVTSLVGRASVFYGHPTTGFLHLWFSGRTIDPFGKGCPC